MDIIYKKINSILILSQGLPGGEGVDVQVLLLHAHADHLFKALGRPPQVLRPAAGQGAAAVIGRT